MTDPNAPTENPLIALTICILIFGGVPLLMWVAMTWTKQRWATIWGAIKQPPSHAARTTPTCPIHAQDALDGMCTTCLAELHADLDTLEWGETR